MENPDGILSAGILFGVTLVERESDLVFDCCFADFDNVDSSAVDN